MADDLLTKASVISLARLATSGESRRHGSWPPMFHSWMMRPGRDDISSTRWLSRTASRTLCVTKMIVIPVSSQMRVSSSCRRSRVMASRAANGSSMSRIDLPCASARAMATRWRIPPESSCGRWSYERSRCTRPRSSFALALRSARGTPLNLSASSTLRPAVSHGKSAASWNMRVGSPTVSIVPDVCVSSREIRLRRVDLPHPDAPTRDTNSPGRTSRLTSSRTIGPSAVNCLTTCWMRTAQVVRSRCIDYWMCATGERHVNEPSLITAEFDSPWDCWATDDPDPGPTRASRRPP